jgi:hypothetical protein
MYCVPPAIPIHFFSKLTCLTEWLGRRPNGTKSPMTPRMQAARNKIGITGNVGVGGGIGANIRVQQIQQQQTANHPATADLGYVRNRIRLLVMNAHQVVHKSIIPSIIAFAYFYVMIRVHMVTMARKPIGMARVAQDMTVDVFEVMLVLSNKLQI